MARFITFLFLAVIVLNAELVTSSNQHMTCQTVDICSDEEHLPRQARALQGPPGKHGVPGVKGHTGLPGSKGDRGIPGFVNLTAIDMSIQSRIKSKLESQKTAINALNATNYDQQRVIKTLVKSVKFLKEENRREKSESKKVNETVINLMREVSDKNSIILSLQTSVQTLESDNGKMREDIQTLNKIVNSTVSDINSIISSLQTSVQTLESENRKMREDMQTLNKTMENKKCENDDIYYGGYCFWFDVTYRRFAASESKCKSRHSTAGHIINSFHYDIMMKMLRAQIPSGSSHLQFWLGLRQNPSSGSVTIISNGLEASFLRWHSGEPGRHSSETNIYLRVENDASYVYNGMGDWPPWGSAGVICQYKSL